MRRATRLVLLCVVTAGLALADAAHAQPLNGFQLNRYEPTAAGEWSFAVDHPWYSSTRRFAAGLTLNYGHQPLLLGLVSDSGFQQTQVLISNLVIGHLDGAVSFLDRVLVQASLPVTLAETGSAGHGATIGDPRIGALARIWGQPFGSVFSISAGAHLWIPLRKISESIPVTASDQQIRVMPKVVVGGVWRRLLWSATGAALIRQDAVLTGLPIGNAETARVGTELQLGVAASYYDAERRFSIGPELLMSTTVNGDTAFSRYGSSVEALLGGQYNIARMVQVGLAAGVGFVRQPGTPDGRALLRVAYAPLAGPRVQEKDSDGDGIPDREDACPRERGIRTGDAMNHGCPPKVLVLDRDRDGVPDGEDVCPDVPQGLRADPEKRGCPGPALPPPDRDADGIFDRDDQCPDVPQGQQPDPTRKGCPAQDSDKDGVLDPLDQCLFEPAGLFPDPNQPGCPLADKDGDQVPDPQDACPNKPGAPHPDPKKNGCPGLVEVKNGQIVIMRPVFFAPDKDNILLKSYQVLQAVVDALAAVPTLKRIGIEGHTDGAGVFAHNLDLSDRRAKSVQRWLVSRGVAPDRLEAKGYGPTRPIASNKTNAGRAKNRRVEFHILDNSPTAPAATPTQGPAKAPEPAGKPGDVAPAKSPTAAPAADAQQAPAAAPAKAGDVSPAPTTDATPAKGTKDSKDIDPLLQAPAPAPAKAPAKPAGKGSPKAAPKPATKRQAKATSKRL